MFIKERYKSKEQFLTGKARVKEKYFESKRNGQTRRELNKLARLAKEQLGKKGSECSFMDSDYREEFEKLKVEREKVIKRELVTKDEVCFTSPRVVYLVHALLRGFSYDIVEGNTKKL